VSVALRDYADAAGPEVIDALERLARPLRGRRVVHVNSTRVGGGVAEILARLVPLMKDLGMDAGWEVIEGTPDFYGVTKTFHNALQGVPSAPSAHGLEVYDDVNREAARRLGPSLAEADFVFIHDPQPAAILRHLPKRRGRWVWRCHIDVSRPHRPVWKFLRPIVAPYDASVTSMAAFAQPLPHPQYIIAPSIDPLSDKNRPLEESEVLSVAARHGLDPERPVVVQVSRFDRFKDPIGVLQAYRIAKRRLPIQLVLVGGTATDDPEGDAVLAAVREAAGSDPDVHVLLLPPDAHREINALQRRATLVMQNSLK
jgi:trehalose synthase